MSLTLKLYTENNANALFNEKREVCLMSVVMILINFLGTEFKYNIPLISF